MCFCDEPTAGANELAPMRERREFYQSQEPGIRISGRLYSGEQPSEEIPDILPAWALSHRSGVVERSVDDQLRQLESFYEQGVLTEGEYEDAKERILQAPDEQEMDRDRTPSTRSARRALSGSVSCSAVAPASDVSVVDQDVEDDHDREQGQEHDEEVQEFREDDEEDDSDPGQHDEEDDAEGEDRQVVEAHPEDSAAESESDDDEREDHEAEDHDDDEREDGEPKDLDDAPEETDAATSKELSSRRDVSSPLDKMPSASSFNPEDVEFLEEVDAFPQ